MSKVKTYRPSELAEELGVPAKVLRNYLRSNFTRDAEAKNTAWVIDAPAAKACKEHFAKNVTPSTDDADEA